jgi:uncharacterized membrane protein YqaE (UPF0057 family)
MTTTTYDLAMTQRAASGGSLGRELFRVVIAVFLPPVAVFLRIGMSPHFVINLLLTLVGYLPGLIHAIWVLAQTSRHRVRIE